MDKHNINAFMGFSMGTRMISAFVEKIFTNEINIKYLPKLVINCGGCDNFLDLNFLEGLIKRYKFIYIMIDFKASWMFLVFIF
jgi:hypothetical protein